MTLASSLVVLLQATAVLAASAADWRNRIIYQALTDRFARSDGSTSASCNTADRVYCGGTWKGLMNKLDYIQNMGFTAVWISPVTQQIQGQTADGSSYHGYWQNSLYDLNSNYGTADDLKALSSALHSRGMYLMVDIVVNHFAWPGSSSSVDYSTYNPFNSASYFHSYCPITDDDYNNNQTAVETCWLGDSNVELTDVNTSEQTVINTYNSWINDLVSTYGIDGLRIDTVKHVQKGFWPAFNTASGVYCVGEVASGDPAYALPYQEVVDGILNYPLYYPLVRAFQSTSGSMSDLVNMVNTVKSTAKDSTLLGPFLENHDNPRFPSYTGDMALAENAIAFTLLYDGVPILYAGQEQHYSGTNDPYNREATWLSGYSTSSTLYGFVGKINQLRNHAIYADSSFVNYKAYSIYSDTTTIAMRKSGIVAVLSNKGANGAGYTQTIPNTGFSGSVVEILGCTTVNADSSGNISVNMSQGAARIFYSAAGLSGSGICGH